MKRVFLILGLLLSTLSMRGEVLFVDSTMMKFPSKLSRDTILIGDQIEWTMQVMVKKGEEIVFEPFQNPVTQGVELIGTFKLDTLKSRKDELLLEGKAIITSFDSGTFYLPEVMAAIEHLDGRVDTLFFDGPILDVTTIPIDTATFEMYDIKGQYTYPLTFKEVAPYILLLLLLVAAIWLLIRYIRLKKQNRNIFGKPIVKDPAHIVALRSLDKIRTQNLWQNNKQKQYYTAITDTLRIYISDRYNLSAMEMTSNEILDILSKDKELEQRVYEDLSSLFTTADLVKFAKYLASEEENQDAIPIAVRFVNATFLQELEENR
ncbi:MAG: hypothetical protein IKL26_04665 [Bacteroidales bacterium]|nr:hypothetical protein [Bacteroidales bacterium]